MQSTFGNYLTIVNYNAIEIENFRLKKADVTSNLIFLNANCNALTGFLHYPNQLSVKISCHLSRKFDF